MTLEQNSSDAQSQDATQASGIVDLEAVDMPAPVEEVKADITDEDAPLVDLDKKTFEDFGIRSDIAQALAKQGITHPFPIQALTLPVALSKHDIIGQAKTGTGKTLGFVLPALMNVIGPNDEGYGDLVTPGAPQAMIVVPTRELAKQVASDAEIAASGISARVVQIYGGVGFDDQIEALRRGVEVVVGTPGRLLDLLKRKELSLASVRTVVLDEADEMLDLGFLPDVETLLARTPANRQTMLFSATMPGQVIALARRYMSHPTHIRAQDPTDQGATVKAIKQVIYRAHSLNKAEVVARILQAEGRGKTIIFARTKRTCSSLAEELMKRGFAVGSLHGDLGQPARERAMRAFRSGKIDVLVATDVAARGLDIDDVTHVINYQCPEDEKIYLHRIGRTGRAGASGTAVTFVDWDDVPRWRLIDKALGLGMPEPVETYHTSEHLYSDLNISKDVTGKLPRDQRKAEGLRSEPIIGEGTRPKRGGRSGGQRGRNGQGRGRGSEGRNGERTSQGEKPKRKRERRRRVRKSEGE
ncbi:DNA helicase [Boudabousia liubingyangii]|uniref:RNA helicase n=1 Tax=Boudabousia liubingyangii TaxID=1921764 RepID=A0A1Q5PQP3_9ACTO|nr:DNA helicase [Boudabousia liubingyangii]